jgi:hypothetical protein
VCSGLDRVDIGTEGDNGVEWEFYQGENRDDAGGSSYHGDTEGEEHDTSYDGDTEECQDRICEEKGQIGTPERHPRRRTETRMVIAN